MPTSEGNDSTHPAAYVYTIYDQPTRAEVFGCGGSGGGGFHLAVERLQERDALVAPPVPRRCLQPRAGPRACGVPHVERQLQPPCHALHCTPPWGERTRNPRSVAPGKGLGERVESRVRGGGRPGTQWVAKERRLGCHEGEGGGVTSEGGLPRASSSSASGRRRWLK
jgi:hypothetical protein